MDFQKITQHHMVPFTPLLENCFSSKITKYCHTVLQIKQNYLVYFTNVHLLQMKITQPFKCRHGGISLENKMHACCIVIITAKLEGKQRDNHWTFFLSMLVEGSILAQDIGMPLRRKWHWIFNKGTDRTSV